jgi:hypothetical protein
MDAWAKKAYAKKVFSPKHRAEYAVDIKERLNSVPARFEVFGSGVVWRRLGLYASRKKSGDCHSEPQTSGAG